MAISALARKLLVKPGQRMVLLNAPAGYAEALAPLPEGVAVSTAPAADADFVQVFVKDSAELHSLGPQAIGSARPDGLLWICYPKKSSKVATDLTRDVLWDLVKQYGVVGVTLVSIDDTWSAMRFRPADQVGR